MSIQIGSGLVKIELNWDDFKSIVGSKSLKTQYVYDAAKGVYEIFCLDDNIAYTTNIFSGTVPVVCDYDQTTNDTYKADFETNFISNANKRLSPIMQSSDGALKVSTVGRDGSEIVWATHNFCDKTTWFSNSINRFDVLLTSSDGYTFYEQGNTNSWIDLYNGKVLHEDVIRASTNGLYDITVAVDGVTKSINDCMLISCSSCTGDYSINFNSASITFDSYTSGTVRASFSEPQDAWWILRPKADTILAVEGAEMQFSEDIELRDNIVMQIAGYVQVFAPNYWQGNGGPLPTNYKVILGEYQYKSLAEFMDETEGAYPIVPQMGGSLRGLRSAMYGMPFAYKTVRELYDAYGMEIRVGLKHSHEFGGFRATATFYCIEK